MRLTDRITAIFPPLQVTVDLQLAQYRAFRRQIPIMYAILTLNTWILAATFYSDAPIWATITIPTTLTIACIVRVAGWLTQRGNEPSPEQTRAALGRTNRLAPFFAIAFVAWSFLLFPYGDAYQRGYLAFYMSVTVIACIFSLVQLRSAAIKVAVIVNGSSVVFFALAGHSAFVALAINLALVSICMVGIVLVNSGDFAQMVNARGEARAKAEEQAQLLHMIDDMPVAVMTIDRESFTINYANTTSHTLVKEIEHLLSIRAEDLIGAPIDVFQIDPADQRAILGDPSKLPHYTRIELGPEVLDLRISAVTAQDGRYIFPMLSWGIVTREVEIEKKIWRLAHTDALTDIANRFAFNEELERRLTGSGRHTALLFIDLDEFKMINDTRGHRVGDVVLAQVAQRLKALCDTQEVNLGRLGGDEFAVAFHFEDRDSVLACAQKIVSELQLPYEVGGPRRAHVGASIGIALAPEHGGTSEILFGRADIALYAAKRDGKGHAQIFSFAMEDAVHAQLHIETELRHALQTPGNLFVIYQPIFSLTTGETTAREALVRWYMPEQGWMPPSQFVPVAEQSGLIESLGAYVLNTACREAAGWDDDVPVAVNISAGQLGKGTLVATVREALCKSGLEACRLEIEVTETALLDDSANAIAELDALRALGLRIALDDFGTGYSSLAHLRAFPFDKIKIDGSFVRDAIHRPDCAAVVHAVAELGARLGVTTVAEGVETEAHLDLVRREGCSQVQGFLVGRPMPSEEELLRRPAMVCPAMVHEA